MASSRGLLSGALLLGLLAIATMMVAHPGSAIQFRGTEESMREGSLAQPGDEAVAAGASGASVGEDVSSDAGDDAVNDSEVDEKSNFDEDLGGGGGIADEDAAVEDAEVDGKEASKASFVQEASADDDSVDGDSGSNGGHAEDADADSDMSAFDGQDLEKDDSTIGSGPVDQDIQPHEDSD